MKNRPRRYFLYLLLRGVIGLVQVLPRSLALGLAKSLGTGAYYLAARQRNKAKRNLEFAFGHEKTPAEMRRIAKQVFQNCALTAVDVILFPRFTKERLAQWVHFDDEFVRINRILNQGHGVMILTGHIGNWELLAGAFGIMGYYGAVVGRRIYYDKYNQILVKLRESVRVRTIYRDSSPREILRVLKNNHILGILADQDVDSIEGIFVNFFGTPAYTPTAPVKMAMVEGSPIVPGFMIREGSKYRLILEEPIYAVQGQRTKDEAIQEFTAQWSAVVEKYIRQYPEQWVWMHDRWKTKPPEFKKNASELMASGA